MPHQPQFSVQNVFGNEIRNNILSSIQKELVTTYAFPWDTTTNILKLNGVNTQLKGFSLTGTEYMSSLYPYNTFYDYTNNCITMNLVTFINQISQMSTANPIARIPMTADYFLAGSAPTTYGGANVSFTASQYQACITAMMAAITCSSSGVSMKVSTTTPGNYSSGGSTTTMTVYGVPGAVIVLDLHWNYSTQSPKQSANGASSNAANYLSGQQLPMSGVCINGGGVNGTLTDNTLSFWQSVTNLYGITSAGVALNPLNTLPITTLQNTMFELYNEPFIDQLTTSSSGGYVNNFGYLNYYDAFINGGEYYLQGSGSPNTKFSFTGMLTTYNKIRSLGAVNMIAISSSEIYSMMDLSLAYPYSGGETDQIGQFNYANGGENAGQTIVDTYNCFTQLQSSIIASGNQFYNVLANFHPYAGLFSGSSKCPGLYNTTGSYDTYNGTYGFGQMIACLQNKVPSTTYSNFAISFPIIATEQGAFDLPWGGTYETPSTNPLTYSYNISGSDTMTIDDTVYTNPNVIYQNPPNASIGYVNLGTPLYNGTWISSGTAGGHAYGDLVFGNPLVGYMNDFTNFNISFAMWSYRPNNSGDMSGNDCQDLTFGPSATQPEMVSGCYIYDGNYVLNGCSTSVSNAGSKLISFVTNSNQTQTQLPTFTWNNVESPYNGADMQYIFNTYIK